MLIIETAASYLEDIIKIMNESGCTHFSMRMKHDSIGNRCHEGIL